MSSSQRSKRSSRRGTPLLLEESRDLVGETGVFLIYRELLRFLRRQREVLRVHLALVRPRLQRRANVAFDALARVRIVHEEREVRLVRLGFHPLVLEKRRRILRPA